jgi:hypothetical protein
MAIVQAVRREELRMPVTPDGKNVAFHCNVFLLKGTGPLCEFRGEMHFFQFDSNKYIWFSSLWLMSVFYELIICLHIRRS